MKFYIKHESRGRIRIHLAQKRMSSVQAETLLYYLPVSYTHLHQVYTGVTIAVTEGDAKRVVSFCDRTDVEFYAMTEEEINGYLALEKEGEAPVWSDKAGGYGIQTVFGTKFVKGIQGDYYNVMGLPASRVYHELKNLGVLE